MKEIIEKESFNYILKTIIKDIKNTQFRIIERSNIELINLYFRIGKVIEDNWKYGNSFINDLSVELKLKFPNIKGFSTRNLRRMRVFYNEYKNIKNWPVPLANLPWSHNYTLIEKVKNIDERLWYAEKCYENGWTQIVLVHQIDTDLYQRQKSNNKLNNFNKNMPFEQSELAKSIIKDPYIFELFNLKSNAVERDIEEAMLSRIKDILLEFGKGFSFIANQYKISVDSNDYYIDLLFYHLDLRSYIVVELKNTEFKPEYIGQLNFYITSINNTLKKDIDNKTIGLLLCKEKNKLSVEWSLEGINNPIGVSSYEIEKTIPKSVLDLLPTEDDINMHISVNTK